MSQSSVILLEYFSFLTGCIVFPAFFTFAVVSVFEREKRAAGFSFLASLIFSSPYFILAALRFPYQEYLLSVLLVLSVILLIIILLPIRIRKIKIADYPTVQIDERDIMFSRRLLKEGMERYTEYYRMRPQNLAPDEAFRKNPGLLAKGTRFYNAFQFAAAEAGFNTVEALHAILDKESEALHQTAVQPGVVSLFIKEWTKKLGAVDVGFTELKEYHKYSHIGRGPLFGQKVSLNHKYAIALTVEMDKFMMDHAPYGPAVMEFAQQYMEAGAIAAQIAEFIKNLGYPARAHIDGNYRVVCPLVARDAGLGEIGRMGLLMTPRLGPRVRIAVVTTDIPLLVNERTADESFTEFCLRCKKCAEVCPAKAISFNEPKEIDDAVRWQINQEKCFTYWTVSGTDCGRCVSVCPYSHPDNLLHNIVRRGLRHSSAFQILALKMDHFFYGRRPLPKKPSGYLKS